MKAVDGNHAAVARNPRQVVGIGGTDADPGLHYLGLAEGGVKRVGRVQKLHHRARRDRPGRSGLDHGRPDHVEAVSARHDVDRNAWVEQSDLARSEEHTSDLQSLMRISYAVFCLKKKNTTQYTQ